MEALDLAAAAVFITAAVRAGSRHVAKAFHYVDGQRLFSGNNDLVASDERFVLVEEPLDDAEIDIVLIHGLRNSRPSRARPTEAQKDETVSWVRHNLPKTERVRILSYQYDTTLRTPEYLTRRTLLHEAVQLNTRLVHARANVRNQDRPIIFVAHSLGGILLKNALIFSEMSGREDERSILISTAGCLFYDTPHEPLPNKLSESIWATVEPILDPLQAVKPNWQRSEFLRWVSVLVQQTKRFDDIAANMRRKPQYIGLQGCGKASDSLKDYVVLDTLKACLRDLREMDYRAGGVSKRQTGYMAAEAELTLGDGTQASKRIWIISR